MTLVEFLLARLADVEALAEAAMDLEWHLDGGDVMSVPQVNNIAWVGDRHENGQHMARHDPARVLRRVAADRQIVELHHLLEYRGPGDPPGCAVCSWRDDQDELHGDWPCPTLRLLGVVDDGHPDYHPEWRP